MKCDIKIGNGVTLTIINTLIADNPSINYYQTAFDASNAFADFLVEKDFQDGTKFIDSTIDDLYTRIIKRKNESIEDDVDREIVRWHLNYLNDYLEKVEVIRDKFIEEFENNRFDLHLQYYRKAHKEFKNFIN